MEAVDDCIAAKIPMVWLHDALSPGAGSVVYCFFPAALWLNGPVQPENTQHCKLAPIVPPCRPEIKGYSVLERWDLPCVSPRLKRVYSLK